MPLTSVVHREPDLQHVRASGILSLEDIRLQFSTAPSARGYYPGIPTLVDLMQMTGCSLTLPDIMMLRDRMAERHCSKGSPLRVALLAGDETSFGMARIFETVCSDSGLFDVRLSQETGEAMVHLGCSGTVLEKELLHQVSIRSA